MHLAAWFALGDERAALRDDLSGERSMCVGVNRVDTAWQYGNGYAARIEGGFVRNAIGTQC